MTARGAGHATSQAGSHGCPSPDRDGDTFEGRRIVVRTSPRISMERLDLDGCRTPARRRPGCGSRIARVARSSSGAMSLGSPRCPGIDVDPDGMLELRALAQLLNREPSAVARSALRLGARPEDSGAGRKEGFAGSSAAAPHPPRRCRRDRRLAVGAPRRGRRQRVASWSVSPTRRARHHQRQGK